MIEFTWPYMILFFPLPFIIRWLFSRKENKVSGHKLKVPFFKELSKLKINKGTFYKSNYFMFLLLIAAWALIVVASARPIRIADSWSIDVEGRDLMIAIDTSGSMARPETLDGAQVTRLDVVKSVTRELIQKRKGDRVGLIMFGSKAFLYTPLSFDLSLVQGFLDEVFAGMAGPSTAIGDALVLSVKYLYDRPTDNKVLLLMTDGANQGGKFSVKQGIELIKQANVKVYTVGIGFSDSQGDNPVKSEEIDLDEPSLISIAKETQGQYFRVNSGADLKKVFSYIEQLEKIDDTLIRQSIDEIYYEFLGMAVAILIFMLLLHIWVIYKARKEEERFLE